jgi:hypothetical protein
MATTASSSTCDSDEDSGEADYIPTPFTSYIVENAAKMLRRRGYANVTVIGRQASAAKPIGCAAWGHPTQPIDCVAGGQMVPKPIDDIAGDGRTTTTDVPAFAGHRHVMRIRVEAEEEPCDPEGRGRNDRVAAVLAALKDPSGVADREGCRPYGTPDDDEAPRRVVVVFVESSKVTIEIVKCLIASNDRYHRVIVVHEKCLTPDARSAITVNRLFTFETHSYADLSYDPIAVVPRHYRVSIAADIGPGRAKFPVILATDVICRYYAFVKGDIVAIEENFDGAPSLSYRRCV